MFRYALLAACLIAAMGLRAEAQLLEKLPPEMQGVGIDDKSGDQVPLDLKFRDEDGNAITLADVFAGDRPVLMSLNYSDCPMLCRVQLDGVVRCLRELKWTTGQEFDVVSVSIDPNETVERAKQTEQRYLSDYARKGAAPGWRFLTGPQESITALADAVGFRYKFVPETGEFSHSAAVMVIMPTGIISRYLYGVVYDPQTVRLSLVEAGEGKIGSPLDQLILFCFHYDETKGRYGPVARRIMSGGAAVTIVVLALGLVPYWRRRSTMTQPTDPTQEDSNPPSSEPSSIGG